MVDEKPQRGKERLCPDIQHRWGRSGTGALSHLLAPVRWLQSSVFCVFVPRIWGPEWVMIRGGEGWSTSVRFPSRVFQCHPMIHNLIWINFFSVILLFEHLWVFEANSSLSRWKWHFCFTMQLLSQKQNLDLVSEQQKWPSSLTPAPPSKRREERYQKDKHPCSFCLGLLFVILSSVQEATFSSTSPHLSDGLSPPSTGCV